MRHSPELSFVGEKPEFLNFMWSLLIFKYWWLTQTFRRSTAWDKRNTPAGWQVLVPDLHLLLPKVLREEKGHPFMVLRLGWIWYRPCSFENNRFWGLPPKPQVHSVSHWEQWRCSKLTTPGSGRRSAPGRSGQCQTPVSRDSWWSASQWFCNDTLSLVTKLFPPSEHSPQSTKETLTSLEYTPKSPDKFFEKFQV